jgi:hypothetical protein
MIQRFCGIGVVIATVLVVWPCAVTLADEQPSISRVAASIAAPPGGQPLASTSSLMPSQAGSPFAPAATGYDTPEASWPDPVQLPTVDVSMPHSQPLSVGDPPVVAPADVTCRDDGHYVILTINGQQLRFAKSQPVSEPSEAPNAKPVDEGTVHGRLLHKGQPVANCCVAIVCLRKENVTDSSDEGRLLMSATTDEQGVYCFEHVPAGDYKLTWLPNGTKQWIRRIALRPDAVVHAGQDVNLKDVRMALQTIN